MGQGFSGLSVPWGLWQEKEQGQPELEVETVSPFCSSQAGASSAQSEVSCAGWGMSPLLLCVPDL